MSASPLGVCLIYCIRSSGTHLCLSPCDTQELLSLATKRKRVDSDDQQDNQQDDQPVSKPAASSDSETSDSDDEV